MLLDYEKEEILLSVTTLIELKDIELNEISQKDKYKTHMILFIHRI